MIVWMQELFGIGSRPFWELITNLNSPPILVILISFAMWLHGTKLGVRLAFISVVGGYLIEIAKMFITIPRPYYHDESVQAWRDSDGFGMPSGHASGSVTMWGTLSVSLGKRWLYPLSFVLIALIGLSRIYFGVHSLDQVISGWIVGFGMIFVLVQVEEPLIRWLHTVHLWAQIALSVVVVLLFFGFIQYVAPTLNAAFQIPEQWTERHQEAQAFEAALKGESVDEYKELELFGTLGFDALGQLIGLLFVGLFVLHRGGFENYSGRERIANVIIGGLMIAGLVPLILGIDKNSIWALPLWSALPILLALVVPWAGRWCARRI